MTVGTPEGHPTAIQSDQPQAELATSIFASTPNSGCHGGSLPQIVRWFGSQLERCEATDADRCGEAAELGRNVTERARAASPVPKVP